MLLCYCLLIVFKKEICHAFVNIQNVDCIHVDCVEFSYVSLPADKRENSYNQKERSEKACQTSLLVLPPLEMTGDLRELERELGAHPPPPET